MRLIDAEALREKAHKLPNGYNWGWFHKCVDEMIDTAPTIDPVKHGKWIEYPIAEGMNKCSECGVLRFGESNYCPNCGAQMERSEE